MDALQTYQILPKKVINTRIVKTWTEEEDRLLKQLHKQYRQDWNQISSKIKGRNPNQCLHRFRRITHVGEQNQKLWTEQEDQKVLQLFKITGKNWRLISQKLKTKTGKQIRQRYINKLNPEINRDSWSRQEDFIIIKEYKTVGTKWSQISKKLKGRPQNMIKNRFYSYIMKNYEIKQMNIKNIDEVQCDPKQKVGEICSQKTATSLKILDSSTNFIIQEDLFKVPLIQQLESLSLSLQMLNSSNDYQHSFFDFKYLIQ